MCQQMTVVNHYPTWIKRATTSLDFKLPFVRVMATKIENGNMSPFQVNLCIKNIVFK